MPRRRSKGPDIIKRFTFFLLCFLCSHCLISCKIFLIWLLLIDREPNVKLSVLLILKNEKKILFAWIYFRESFFCNISCGFNFANWLPVDFSWGFIFMNFSFINVLYILSFSWFVLQPVVCMQVTELLLSFFDISNRIIWI